MYHILMSAYTIDDTFLYTHSLFGGLSTEELQYLKEFFCEETYQSGECILQQGEPNNRVFFILSGEVQILKHIEEDESTDRLLITLTAGDTFGEMELIDIQPCAASAMASQTTVLVTFTNYDLYQLSKTHIGTYAMIIRNLAREISRRLRKTDDDLAHLLYRHDH